MGELVNKQKVTLTLNKEVYKRTREFLNELPGKPSVSSLVDDLLDQFVSSLQPAMRDLLLSQNQDPAHQIEILKRSHGELSTLLGLELAGTIRAVEAESEKGDDST